MTLKKIGFGLLITILITMAAAACGKSSDSTNPATTQTTTSKTTAISTTTPSGTTSGGASFDSTATTTTTAPAPTAGTTQVSLDLGEKLPDGYPNDVLPIYPGSYILSAIGEGSSYTISAYSKDTIDKLIAFYQKALEKAAVTSETVNDTSYTSWGNISGYTYIFDVAEDAGYQDYKSSIMISIYK